jgi:NADPH-dependent 2,4-dienoyl-CoA reductase/sulfur reductase-like enzyme
MSEPPQVAVNGQALAFDPRISTAAALALTQTSILRRSVGGQPRGPVCGMGVCFECRLTLDGQPQRLSCQLPARAGMEIQTADWPASGAGHTPTKVTEQARDATKKYDVLVLGAGPAGVAAACAAGEAGQRVGIVDDNPDWGGQIWRQAVDAKSHQWFRRALQAKVELLAGARAIAICAPRQLLAETAQGRLTLEFSRLILATGARELFLPFPGWTVPNVMGAGGLQALAKTGLDIRGKRVVVAGTGPLLLAVAAYLHAHGAEVSLIAEQAPLGKLARFGLGLYRQPGKLLEALGLRWRLRSVALRTGCWPLEAHGTDRVEGVTLTNGQRTWTEGCDYLACGFGLVPNVELPLLLGCALDGGAVQVDALQETTMPGVYCAGETTGVGGVEKSLVEGLIAGYAAAGRGDEARRWFGRREKMRRFGRALERTFALRNELKTLAQPDTVVCRCEDVTLGQLKPYESWRAAKLQTRAGMGPCQGRICGAALSVLRGWQVESIRPPVCAARVESLICNP